MTYRPCHLIVARPGNVHAARPSSPRSPKVQAMRLWQIRLGLGSPQAAIHMVGGLLGMCPQLTPLR